MGTYTISISEPEPAKAPGSGALRIVLGFALVLGVGTLLLSLPFTAASGEATHPFDALFTAVSAICVTGLVVFETQEHWSFWGELVILLLIQVGGLGYMMGTSLILWVIGRRLGVRDLQMLRLYYGAPTMGETVAFARRVAMFTFAAEAAGAAVLYVAFVAGGVGAGTSVWWAVFHSISAFNNAGFSVTGNDIIDFRENAGVLLTISTLVIIGGLGALPVLALVSERGARRLSLDSKLVFATSAALLALGTAFVLLAEWDNDATLGTVSAAHRPVLALFQATMPRTAGFSAVDIQALTDESKFLTVGLMFIGGAAGSTAGGIKVGTFSILLIALVATLRAQTHIRVFRRAVPESVVLQALTIAFLGLTFVFLLAVALLQASDSAGLDVLFEALSAFGTVGLSTGVTMATGTAGRAVIIVGMLVGRFGPMILVLEMTRPRRQSTVRLPEDSIRMG
jgi:trk system potassium uptake protein TrkH